jgi:curved DNA-binding protein CbpA
MAASPDPYRTLGLGRDASTEEIRRAYRRLAKANHPDSAGEAALPRFLAIQAAYEVLIGPGRGRRPGARPTPGRSAPQSEPWRADPDRARTTREAYERRTGRRPGERPTGEAQRGTSESREKRGGPAPGGPAPGGPSPGPRRRGDRKRSSNKATPGSTTYDAAEDEPFEPEWSGGTWYGASSGTYWTINPKEYADPRKHGPEYQRRAQRRLDEAPSIDDATRDEPIAGGNPPGADSWTTSADAPTDDGATAPPYAPDDLPTAPHLGILGGFGGRVALALLGWPPLGVAIATIAGEATGCSRFAASCVELFGVGTWLAQLAIIAVLLALPSVAAASAVGTVAALAAAVPTAVFLSATGGAREPAASAAVLAVALGAAYLGGVVFAVTRRRRLFRVP